MLYRLAVETGLRANELRTLKVSSFDFDDCTVVVEAAYSKHRRRDVLHLRHDTIIELRAFVAGKLPMVLAFDMPDKPAKMLKLDLAATETKDAKGEVVIEAIPYIDGAGRYADFYCLRHTMGTSLAAAGVHPKTAQSIMRHSTIELTMNKYTHTLAGQESDAVAMLPDLSQPSQQSQRAIATGTDGKNLARFLARETGKHSTTSDNMGQANCTGDNDNAFLNAPGEIRTHDLRFRKPALYPTELRARPALIIEGNEFFLKNKKLR